MPLSKEVIKDKAILKINAHQNPSILIPSTKFAANKTTIALITKEKRPKVKIVNGKPKIFKMGVTIKFKIPKIKAKTRAVVKSSIWTPVKTLVKRNATIAVTKSRIIIFIIYFFIKL